MGEDLQGNAYESLEQMWKLRIHPAKSNVSLRASSTKNTKQSWYKVAVDYWDRQEATVKGVLGGYDEIHEAESKTSEKMIRDFLSKMPSNTSALDCGAGIGRVAKFVLKKIFTHVDLLEPSST